ncbi:MAG TPA: hypothetical protein PLK99_02835 [Burkholderiales bacterium]|nr:hypothetical protein [Burkholderiales bacterium]
MKLTEIYSKRFLVLVTAFMAAPISVHAAGASGNGASVQGAAPQGGGRSGGTASPGGGPRTSPGLVGGSGPSYGPGSTSNERAGYLGGRTTATDPTDGSPGGTNVAGTSGIAQNSSCQGVIPSDMTVASRMGAGNLARFRQAESILGHGSEADDGSKYLLANYQEELAKPNPDLSLVGTYVGLIADRTVTASTIERISRALCVPVEHDQAAGIARAAENQRMSLGHGRR